MLTVKVRRICAIEDSLEQEIDIYEKSNIYGSCIMGSVADLGKECMGLINKGRSLRKV